MISPHSITTEKKKKSKETKDVAEALLSHSGKASLAFRSVLHVYVVPYNGVQPASLLFS